MSVRIKIGWIERLVKHSLRIVYSRLEISAEQTRVLPTLDVSLQGSLKFGLFICKCGCIQISCRIRRGLKFPCVSLQISHHRIDFSFMIRRQRSIRLTEFINSTFYLCQLCLILIILLHIGKQWLCRIGESPTGNIRNLVINSVQIIKCFLKICTSIFIRQNRVFLHKAAVCP